MTVSMCRIGRSAFAGGVQQSKFDQIGERLGDDGLLQRFILTEPAAGEIEGRQRGLPKGVRTLIYLMTTASFSRKS